MRVSIITATYNSSATISSALEAIKSQDYPEIEWILVDGASKDETVNIVKSGYTGNLVIKSEKDSGIYDALNKGVDLATGEIIGFLHSDDMFASTNVISEIIKQFADPEVDGVYGDLQYVSSSDTGRVIRNWKSADFKQSRLKFGWMPAHPTLFLRKGVYEKHGRFSLEFRIAADYEFILRIFKDKTLKFKYLPLIFTKMRTGGASNNMAGLRRKMSEDLKAIRSNKVGIPFLVLISKNLRKVRQLF